MLQAELPSELVGLDVTRQMVFDSADVERLGRTGAPLARWLHEALRFYVEFHRQHEGLDGCVLNDVLPIAALLRPETVTFKRVRIAVGLEDDARRGQTRVAPDGAGVLVATEVRIPAIRALLSERVFRRAALPEVPAPEPRGARVEAHA